MRYEELSKELKNICNMVKIPLAKISTTIDQVEVRHGSQRKELQGVHFASFFYRIIFLFEDLNFNQCRYLQLHLYNFLYNHEEWQKYNLEAPKGRIIPLDDSNSLFDLMTTIEIIEEIRMGQAIDYKDLEEFEKFSIGSYNLAYRESSVLVAEDFDLKRK